MKGSVDYLCWLMNQAGVDAEGPDGYLQLCVTLQNTLWQVLIDMDENRVRNAEGEMPCFLRNAAARGSTFVQDKEPWT